MCIIVIVCIYIVKFVNEKNLAREQFIMFCSLCFLKMRNYYIDFKTLISIYKIKSQKLFALGIRHKKIIYNCEVASM